MTRYEREQLKTVVGMLTALEYVIDTPDSAADVATEAKDIIKDLLEGERCLEKK